MKLSNDVVCLPDEIVDQMPESVQDMARHCVLREGADDGFIWVNDIQTGKGFTWFRVEEVELVTDITPRLIRRAVAIEKEHREA